MALLFTLFAMPTQTQAAGSVNHVLEKTGYWLPYEWSFVNIPNFTSAAEACEETGRLQRAFIQGWQGVFVGTQPNTSNSDWLNCIFRDSATGYTAVLGAAVERTRYSCPANSTRDAMNACICNDNYNPDTTRTSCVPVAPPVTCPIDKLPDFPLPTDDSCTKSLEKGAGKDFDKACPPLDDRWTKPNGGQLQCLADKISKLGLSVPYTEPSATIRTVAYQKHFVDIWKWHMDILKNQGKWSDAQKQVCAPTVAKVEAELAIHGIDAPPSKKEGDAPHVLGNAIDIPRGVKNALITKVSNSIYITFIPPFCLFCKPVPVPIGDVQDYVNSTLVNPPACNLRWGGRFDPYDPVHFQLQ